jgi:hypothetical protein
MTGMECHLPANEGVLENVTSIFVISFPFPLSILSSSKTAIERTFCCVTDGAATLQQSLCEKIDGIERNGEGRIGKATQNTSRFFFFQSCSLSLFLFSAIHPNRFISYTKIFYWS